MTGVTRIVHIRPDQSPTGVGIVQQIYSDRQSGFIVTSPCCNKHLVYKNSHDPDIGCEGCRKYYTKFPPLIGRKDLLHRGPWTQFFTWKGDFTVMVENDLRDWIRRWTGLDVEIMLTYEDDEETPD